MEEECYLREEVKDLLNYFSEVLLTIDESLANTDDVNAMKIVHQSMAKVKNYKDKFNG